MSCCAGIAGRGGTMPALAIPCGSRPRPDRLVRLPGGRFVVGTPHPLLPNDGEGPPREVLIKPFAIDPFAATVAGFAEFVAATGYRSESERFGWSLVFTPGGPPARPNDAPHWWRRVEGADWRHPHGPGAEAPPSHPVTQVSWNDSRAFAGWAGGRLPSEAEWEYAAAAGRRGARYPWGDAEPDDSSFMPCNIWQGSFPTRNTEADGHAGTAPVDAYPPNGFGLYNMAGNTWEWCAEPFRIRSVSPAAKRRNEAARAGNMRLLKGGSHLCHRAYCHRYRIAARSGADADSATTHVGFRLVFDLA